MTSKLDRRIKYTRMVLKNSLIKLLKEKQISTITVKEICELADINRSTFYSHYKDPYDLLNKIEDDILSDMYETLGKYNFNKEEEALQMTEKLIKYIAQNRDICQILLSDHGNASFQNKVMEFAKQFIFNSFEGINGIDQQDSDYMTVFVVSGSIHVIKSWLDNGLNKSSKEIAEIIINITNKGLFYYYK